jgi:hypothetical protein
MEQAIVALVVTLLCLAGAFAALFLREPRAEGADVSRPPRWCIAALCSITSVVAVIVLTVYLYA